MPDGHSVFIDLHVPKGTIKGLRFIVDIVLFLSTLILLLLFRRIEEALEGLLSEHLIELHFIGSLFAILARLLFHLD